MNQSTISSFGNKRNSMGLEGNFASQSVFVDRNASRRSSGLDPFSSKQTKFINKTDSLPPTFDIKAVEARRQQNVEFCQLCEAAFSRLGNPIRHCKRCAKAICKVCSENARQLSIQDKELHRVCDECDTKMDNYTI